MAGQAGRDFCIKCGKDTEYALQKEEIVKTIREKQYTFVITVARCAECKEEMSIPGLLDCNVKEIDGQYRAAEGLVSTEDIERLMKIYQLGKASFSAVLGLGEVVTDRYLAGQAPAKEHSDRIKAALSSPSLMRSRLVQSRAGLTEDTYQKALAAAGSLEKLFAISGKMLKVITCVFEGLEEVTPLMLQKLLYFIQGIYCARYQKPMFPEDCRAWVHGPVYPEVYDLFRDFKYDPIDDARFVMLNSSADALTDEEKGVIELVINTFGMYGGKTLEKITHNEEPWRNARRGYGEGSPSNEILRKESIQKYYERIEAEYGLEAEQDVMRYIQAMLAKEFRA